MYSLRLRLDDVDVTRERGPLDYFQVPLCKCARRNLLLSFLSPSFSSWPTSSTSHTREKGISISKSPCLAFLFFTNVFFFSKQDGFFGLGKGCSFKALHLVRKKFVGPFLRPPMTDAKSVRVPKRMREKKELSVFHLGRTKFPLFSQPISAWVAAFLGRGGRRNRLQWTNYGRFMHVYM